MKNADNASYYINKKSEMLKDFEKMFKACKRAIVRKNPAINISRMHQESKRIFLDYLPVLPFIGGKKNRGTTNLVGGAIFLAVIRVLETEKMSERDIGEVVY